MIGPGSRLGVYEITARIGAGGMGEVYRARDARLERDVAIKVLPPAMSSDPDRLARFDREARVLASFNHPNIGAIYGFEDAGDVRAIVLELVEGPTLSDRIARGPIPLREALPIARQIADALDAAHEKGVVHRDLKPANIKLTPDGSVKVLDFGLAKALDSDAERSSVATFAADTRAGVIVGTAAYMSPEQARGLPVDKRTDVWAFGCVLYEMLTGGSAFGGETISDTIAAIIEREPDWSRLPGNVPPGVQDLLRRCLTKDVKRRFRDIGDVRADLDALSTPDRESERSRTELRALPWVLASGSIVVAGFLATKLWMAPDREAAAPVTRATITLPGNLSLDTLNTAYPLALSADGRRLVYVGRGVSGTQLYLRHLDAFDATPLPGSDGARYPFFSPDGQSVAFFTREALKRAAVEGGSAVTVCEIPVIAQGGTWGDDDTIVFAAASGELMRVPAAGGKPLLIATRGLNRNTRQLIWPHFLPGSRAVLATNGNGAEAALGVLSLDTGDWREIGRASQAQYVESGHLLFHASAVREGEIHAVRFDLDSLASQGRSVAVREGVFRSENAGGAYYAVARNGTFLFAPGGHARALARYDANGRRTALLGERRGFRMPSVSPNGRYLSVTIDPRPSQVWVYDLLRKSGMPLAAEGHSIGPVWTRDGFRVAYFSRHDIYWRPFDGSGDAQRLLASDGTQYPMSWTKDGRVLVFCDEHPKTRSDVWMWPIGGDPRSLIATGAHEINARLSPDDRWLAYSSDESGRSEVYVRPFPNVEQGKWLVSNSGGGNPVWSRDGRRLFYIDGTRVMSVSVTARGTTFDAGPPEFLFTGPFETGSPQFDVFPDGSFAMVEADPDAKPTQIDVVTNWTEELKRLVP